MVARIVSLTLSLLFLSGCLADVREPVAETEQPIVGGQVATAETRYGTVALVNAQGGMHCTGTVIAPTVVLTAAHCLRHRDPKTFAFTTVYEPHEVQVLAGAIHVDQPGTGQMHAVSQVLPHPSFPFGMTVEPSGLGREDDIAVLILQTPVTVLTPVPIMALEPFDTQVPPLTPLWLSGYGNDHIIGSQGSSGVLRYAESPYQRRTEHEMFVGGPNLPDSCPGDSGGPAYIHGQTGPQLVGVNSRGEYQVAEMCGAGGMYTWAPAYEDWIISQAGGAYPYFAPGAAGQIVIYDGPSTAPPSDDNDDDDEPSVTCNYAGPRGIEGSSAYGWAAMLLIGVGLSRRAATARSTTSLKSPRVSRCRSLTRAANSPEV